MKTFFNTLKPGGILAVEQHRAPEGSDPKAGTGYVPESYVIAAAEKAGFVFDGRSWIFFTLSADPNFHDFAPSLIAMTGIVPGTPSLQLLTSATQPRRARRDPEYFITANGPYIYYNRYLVSGGTKVSEGVFRVDTGLGLSSR